MRSALRLPSAVAAVTSLLALCSCVAGAQPTAPTIEFGGQTWEVKTDRLWGPGPNRWTASNVRVDDEGLRLSVAQEDGEWTCAGVSASKGLGYGEYRWEVEADFTGMGTHHVFACFIYEADDREMEAIEVSRWGKPDDTPVFQHVVQPGAAESRHRFFASARKLSIALTWEPRRVKCRTWDGEAGLPLTHWTYAGPKVPLPTDKARARMNLWLFRGKAGDKGSFEALVRDFTFTPLPDPPSGEKKIYVKLARSGDTISGVVVGVPQEQIDRYAINVYPTSDLSPLHLYRGADHAGKPTDVMFSAWFRLRVELVDKATGAVAAQAYYPD